MYEYLGEDWFEHDFNNVVQQTHENEAYSLPFGEHTIRSKVEPVQPDYSELLGKELANQVKADLRVFYDTFYPRQY